jgi:hypothetical protein
MERFFEANKRHVMGWMRGCNKIPHIHEILGHLGAAQAKEPKIGPLWRVVPPQGEDDPRLLEALRAFDSLIAQDVTPRQHCNLIDLVCRDLAFGPPEAFKGYFRDYRMGMIDALQDPCLRLLAQSYAGSGGNSFYVSSEDIDGPLKDSWARIATYLMEHPERTRSPSILKLQGSLWRLIPNEWVLCSTALRDPEVLVSDLVTFTYWLLNALRLIYSGCSSTL